MSLILAALITIAATGAAIAAMLLVRRRAPEGSHFQDGDRASGVFGVLATGFAVLLGLVVVLAFTSYDESNAGAETEALVLFQQSETARFMPAAVRDRLGGELICYGRTVVHRQWPALEDGTIVEASNPWSIALYRTFQAADPKSPTEQSAFDRWLEQTADRESATNDRLHGAEGVIPPQLWLVLLLIAGIVVGYVLFFADSGEHRVVQAMLIGSVVAVVTLTLLLIHSLDNPYKSGGGGLKPVAMERALRLMDRKREIDGNAGRPLPCDARGFART